VQTKFSASITESPTGNAAPVMFCAYILLALVLPAAMEAGTHVVNSLDPAQLPVALQAGRTVTFAATGSIVQTNTITISNNVVLDGTNQSITISGGEAAPLCNVLPAGRFALRRLILANGADNASSGSPNPVPGPSG